MRIVGRIILAVVLLLLLVAGVLLWYVAHPNVPQYTAPDKLNLLPQWSEQTREHYYYTPQGTQVKGLHYDWFTQLRQPFSDEKFADPANLARYGFLIDPEQLKPAKERKLDPNNPGNLPVGFARHRNGETGPEYLDITCSACHTGELRYNGQAVRIDGGAAMHSIASTVPTVRGGAFGQALGMSMLFTYINPWKFDRFADDVLGKNPNGDAKDELRKGFREVLGTLLGTAFNDTRRGLYPTEEGPGRADAFGRIANGVFGDHISPDNYRVANAPVNYPQLWDIWKFDWVQWNGSAMQPMARNIGEALGVGATLQLLDHDQPVMGDARYQSSVRVNDLYSLEEGLKTLKPPTWPAQVFGEVDLKRASQGRALFRENCERCHGPHVKKPGDPDYLAPARVPEWRMTMVDTSVIGTDPTTADNIANHTYDLTPLKWQLSELNNLNVLLVPQPKEQLDLTKLSAAKGLAYITAYVEQRAYQDAGISPEKQPEMNGYGLKIGVRELTAYKARSLEGIWATPPFLHNGSVPNLFQLLSPVAERDTQFYVGTFDFDPKFVGYKTAKFPGGFLYKTSVTGNSNRGHEFRDGCRKDGVIGRALSPDERWALVEYLKVKGDPAYEPRLTDETTQPWTSGPACE
ncbi:di-heme-cytochrome C peroxidase [Pseudomonas citronellolis]|uniref:di-heme-cytochrome C peroxidase n=1 Tax=Pseudomonas citronellolis TaxID=53408 RepID=UPI0023E383E2|nr:di-heme-cytochrome C peroxidase [Pseudomonas citronellolis]MDF3935202.1 di-heme-cytochrome C peroxidase [Pseudomonas citronellolis]